MFQVVKHLPIMLEQKIHRYYWPKLTILVGNPKIGLTTTTITPAFKN
jgi:hypothetical protein